MTEIIDSDDNLQKDFNQGIISQKHQLPNRLYLIPSPTRPFFPGQIQPILVDLDTWGETIDQIAKTHKPFLGLVFTEKKSAEVPLSEDFSTIGCVVHMLEPSRNEDQLQLIVKGLNRFRIKRWLNTQPPYYVEVEYLKEPSIKNDEIKAYAMSLISAIKELVSTNPLYGEEIKQYFTYFNPAAPSALTDFAAAITTAEGKKLQPVLETLAILPRMKLVLPLVMHEIEVAKLQNKITDEVNQKVNEQQREYFLKEQLKVIQKELGMTKDDKEADVERFQQRIANKELPAQAFDRFEEEIEKLSMLEIGSPEYSVTRNYLDWLSLMPFDQAAKEDVNLAQVQKTLDRDHDGLQDVKSRIVEFLAMGLYRGNVAGSIILLVGPPGVGKTSIGKSIANAINRPFYRFSVGGMRDEAEIKGHRRTYIGALPGKIIQALKHLEVNNPVIMLDEIDKMGSSFQGDPASALLEVLDPEQNSHFNDHYLDIDIDLSNVLFLCTANQLDTIPPPLLDRMDSIHLSGYITEEKLLIAKKHLVPKLLNQIGFKKSQLKIQDAALKKIIEGYARESGVRQLEKNIHKLVRKILVQLAGVRKNISVKAADVEGYLGKPRFKPEQPLTGVGVITGLAWTSLGGATLPIEAQARVNKTSGFDLTGRLGDVMKESASIAYSFIAGKASSYKIDSSFFDQHKIHLHVPEGATPKDGPSAGITIASALTSLALNKKVKKSLAMTGELTLTGQVLAIGGVREKIIAAKRLNIKNIILPEANRVDYDELPEYLKSKLTIYFVNHFDQVFEQLF